MTYKRFEDMSLLSSEAAKGSSSPTKARTLTWDDCKVLEAGVFHGKAYKNGILRVVIGEHPSGQGEAERQLTMTARISIVSGDSQGPRNATPSPMCADSALLS